MQMSFPLVRACFAFSCVLAMKSDVLQSTGRQKGENPTIGAALLCVNPAVLGEGS